MGSEECAHGRSLLQHGVLHEKGSGQDGQTEKSKAKMPKESNAIGLGQARSSSNKSHVNSMAMIMGMQQYGGSTTTYGNTGVFLCWCADTWSNGIKLCECDEDDDNQWWSVGGWEGMGSSRRSSLIRNKGTLSYMAYSQSFPGVYLVPANYFGSDGSFYWVPDFMWESLELDVGRIGIAPGPGGGCYGYVSAGPGSLGAIEPQSCDENCEYFGCGQVWVIGDSVQEMHDKLVVRDFSYDGKKCFNPGSANRVFKLTGGEATEEKCSAKCQEQSTCVAYSGIFNSWCIGCDTTLQTAHSGSKAYKKVAAPQQ